MSVEVEGKAREWTERRLVVRSVRQAEAAEAALRARVATATAQVEALNLRGRGRKRFEDVETLRQAANEMVQHHRVEEFLWLRYDHHTTTHPVRAYKDRPGVCEQDRQDRGGAGGRGGTGGGGASVGLADVPHESTERAALA